MSKTWLITGASSGFGRSLTEKLLARGDRVAATLRKPERLAHLAEQYAEQLWTADLDVTDQEAIKEVVGRAFKDLGHIDVICSNAGFGIFGAAEELSDKQVEQMVETNLMGSVYLARAAIPYLRKQGDGLLMQMSSQGGQIAFPGFAMYHLTKWGIEGFYESLGAELEHFGIRTTLIEPGVIKTPFYASAIYADPIDAYDDNPALALTRGDVPEEMLTGDQDKVAEAMIEIAELENPPKRALMGSDAYERVTEALKERLAEAESQKGFAAKSDID